MIKKIDIGLWDIFVTFGSGLLVLLLLVTDILLFGENPKDLLWIKEIPSTIFIFVIIPTIFVLGALVDAVAIWLEDNLLKKLFKTIELSEREKKLELLIKQKYMEKEVKGLVEPGFWCKNFLVQNGIETPILVFLSKYGFYRSMAFVFYLNIFVIAFLYGLNSSILILMFISLVLGVVCTKRSHKFYCHMNRTAFVNYLLAMRSKK